jgi:hypothetical protein
MDWWQLQRGRGPLTIEFLEQPNVEYIMEPCPGRQLQFVRHITEAFQYLEGPVELRPELASPLDIQRRDRAVDEVEPNPLSHRKFHLAVPDVIELLVVLLCLL